MTAADTNVRLTRLGSAATARRARRSPLARLLLLLLELFRPLQLYRKLLLFLAFPFMPACIIPVGPEFGDPAGTPNAPPQIADADPFFGEEVTAVGSQIFQIRITDPNVGDFLYLKWIADYPPYTIVNTRQIPTNKPIVPPNGDGTPINELIETSIDCNAINSSFSHHKIMAVVADRDFVNVAGNLLVVRSGGQYALATWYLNLTCPLQ
jgi:hypothetical protein